MAEVSRIKRNSGVNVFGVMHNFARALKDRDIPSMNAAIDGLDGSIKQVLSSRALVGARQNIMNMSRTSLDNAFETNANLLSQVQDADSIKTFYELSRNENMLTTAIETSKKLLIPSLMSFLK